LPEVLSLLQERISLLKERKIPVDKLLVTQTLSRELAAYKVLSPAARAACQLQASGKNIHMGQRIQFVYTRTKQGVHAWDVPESLNSAWIDTPRYQELLFRAVHEVLQPLGVTESVLRNWMFTRASYLLPPGLLHHRLEMPLFASLKRSKWRCSDRRETTKKQFALFAVLGEGLTRRTRRRPQGATIRTAA